MEWSNNIKNRPPLAAGRPFRRLSTGGRRVAPKICQRHKDIDVWRYLPARADAYAALRRQVW